MGFLQKNRTRNSSFVIRNFEFVIRNSSFVICNLILFACVACNNISTPRPYGYFRISVPDTSYTDFSTLNYPYSFSLSRNAVVQPRSDEPFWINIYYPALDATIHCSYKKIDNNLRELTDDALDFVYRNASFASSIPEREYAHPEAHVYGVLFDLEGNTASSCQFFLTDSTRHFFRASVYCNCPPNADSLAPVYEYLRTDVIKMVETFQWTK
jgi:gliding motility-associated lipoprotein GldD